LNHFTVPVSSTDGPFDVAAWARDRRDATGTAVLESTLNTSVTSYAPALRGEFGSRSIRLQARPNTAPQFCVSKSLT
jgi:hypothetical protein